MTHALYKNNEIPVSQEEVFENLSKYERGGFKCLSCKVKVAFSRGKNDPQFKNWKNVNHLLTCEMPNLENDRKKQYGDIKFLKSIILKTVSREKENNIIFFKRKMKEELKCSRTKKFVYTIYDLMDYKNIYNIKKEYENMEIQVENGEKIKLKELFGTQDEIVERIEENVDKTIVAVVKGSIGIIKEVNGNLLINFTIGKKYKNTKQFKLFISKENSEKNKDKIEEIKNSLVMCYGIAEKNAYGYQMEVISLEHQLVKIKTFEQGLE